MNTISRQGKMRAILIALAALLAFAPALHATTRSYSRIETGYILNDINNHGQIAGYGGEAVIWQNGAAIPLGTLFGPGQFSNATAISDAGHVAGVSVQYSTGETRGFLVTPEDASGDGIPDRWYRDDNLDQVNDLMVDLGPVVWSDASISDVNSFGQVVGQAFTEAFVWFNGVRTNLGQGFASAINDKGQVVGSSAQGWTFLINPEDSNADSVPDRWYRDNDNNGENDLMHFIIQRQGGGQDINEQGQVLLQDGAYADLWTPVVPNGTTGSEIFLDTFPLYAAALNDRAQALVFSSGEDSPNSAALWEGGALVDMAVNPPLSPGSWFGNFYAINNAGWIVADGGNLLIPTVPEPTALAPFTLFTVMLPRHRRKVCSTAAGEAYRQASGHPLGPPARHHSRRSVCAPSDGV